MRKVFINFFVVILIVFFLFQGFSAKLEAQPEAVQLAVNYIKSKPPNPWTTMALAAVEEDNIPSDYLKNINSNSAIDYTAPILAIAALGKDPRTFPDYDYIAKLKSFWDGNQLGDPNLLNDDIFGLLALLSSGEPTAGNIIQGIKNYIISQQNSDGGWGWAKDSNSDTNMTAMAMMALVSAGTPSSDENILQAVQYLKAAQNDDGGFPYDPKSPWGTNSDSSSDAWVISAIWKLGQNPETDWAKGESNPISHLKSLQDPEQGFFHNTPGSGETSFTPTETAYAIIALAQKSYPINIITFSQTQVDFRIEGKNAAVCEGRIESRTAIDIIISAATLCNYEYEIVQSSFGPYLKRINGDSAEGIIGWLYFVNYILPNVGAADYVLEPRDFVLWYFGEYGWPPTRMEVTETENQVLAQVQYFDGENWQPLQEAMVKVGNFQFLTNSSGQVEIPKNALPPGSYQVFAEKEGYVRSNKVNLTIGAGDRVGEGVLLRVILIRAEPPPEDVISFSVTPDEIDFGELQAGDSSRRDVTVTNTGVKIHLEAEVTGASIFRENVEIDEIFWQSFSTSLQQAETKIFPVELSIPGNYSSSLGTKGGELIFWGSKL